MTIIFPASASADTLSDSGRAGSGLSVSCLVVVVCFFILYIHISGPGSARHFNVNNRGRFTVQPGLVGYFDFMLVVVWFRF